MKPENPYAAPQVISNATDRYQSASAVLIDPQEYRRFSQGSGVLLLLCMPFEVFFFFAFEWISFFVLYQALLLGAYFCLTLIPKQQAGRGFYFAALAISFATSCFMLYEAIQMQMLPRYSRNPPNFIIIFFTGKILTTSLMLIGNLRLGLALGNSKLIHSSRWALVLTLLATGSMALLIFLMWSFDKSEWAGLFALSLFFTCGAGFMNLASLYNASQLRAVMIQRLQRQLPDKIKELPPQLPQALDADLAQYHVQ